MFIVNNVIRNIFRKKEEKLNILLINSFFDEYIERLCKLDHNFFIIKEMCNFDQWHSKTIPNLFVCNSQWDQSLMHIDFIITFDRTALYAYSKKISDVWHAPIILVDFASSKVKSPSRCFDQAIEENSMFFNNGIINVSCCDYVKNSWLSPWTSEINYTNYIPPLRGEKPSDGSKILVDKNFTKEYLENIPLIIDNDFTTNYDHASVYLNLWKNATPLMADCMANEVPVVIFNENKEEFKDFEEFCFFINDIESINSIFDSKDFSEKIQKAKNFMEDKTMDFFCDKWSTTLEYSKDIIYKRGEYAR